MGVSAKGYGSGGMDYVPTCCYVTLCVWYILLGVYFFNIQDISKTV